MNHILSRWQACLLVFFFAFLACQSETTPTRNRLDLAGEWQFATDTADVGISRQWFSNVLTDSIELPGTMDLHKKGFLNTDTTTMHLNRVYKYEGPAWYRKAVNIPAQFAGKHLELNLERTKPSKVWIDGQYVGESYILQTPQIYNVTEYLTPGEHTITLRINNDLKLTPYGNVHIYTDETQTNWNGVIGELFLEASPKTHITELQVFPEIDEKKIIVEVAIENGLDLDEINVELRVKRTWDGEEKSLKPMRQTLPCDSLIQLEYALGDATALWDDYQQPLYSLTATISNDSLNDSKTVSFGMRTFSAEGTQFAINGRTMFLRGKHDACVYPLTGHPPMDIDGWKRVFNIAREYGINHCRFHSYSPPKAAFEAADQVGMFLQPELPFWGGLESDTIAAKLQAEGLAMLKHYANHPSFVMFSPGNEIWSGHDRVESIIRVLKEKDSRPLYTMGANNNIGYIGPREVSEFHIAARTPFAHDTMLTHTRLTHAFADSRDGGILNTKTPSTTVNFDYTVSQIDIPLISHEIGQYQIYPDYKEIDKYTGPVRAWNFDVFRSRLAEAGMLDQNAAFHKASGAWSARCYKAEMEAAFRTRNFAGFQLLDLQDFSGQGTALVGILDAFMDSKNVISREKWLQSCNDVVLLLEFPKYCWQTDEKFVGDLNIANYSNTAFNEDVEWQIERQNGQIVASGAFVNAEISQGKLNHIGAVAVEFGAIESAQKLTISLKLDRGGYTNTYPIWVYPTPKNEISLDGITIAERADERMFSRLAQGEKVLLFPTETSVQKNSVAGLFPPDFWNYGMFKSISESNNKPVSPGTLGILTDPDHPIFAHFPTDFHSNWQWFSIIKASRSLNLNKTAQEYRPIVQVIDNLERNNKYGLIFEFAVGEGKLLVCMARLNEISNKPEARQLYKSIVSYMHSDAFDPEYSVDQKLLGELF